MGRLGFMNLLIVRDATEMFMPHNRDDITRSKRLTIKITTSTSEESSWMEQASGYLEKRA
jgi:hypothetical protein